MRLHNKMFVLFLIVIAKDERKSILISILHSKSSGSICKIRIKCYLLYFLFITQFALLPRSYFQFTNLNQCAFIFIQKNDPFIIRMPLITRMEFIIYCTALYVISNGLLLIIIISFSRKDFKLFWVHLFSHCKQKNIILIVRNAIIIFFFL